MSLLDDARELAETDVTENFDRECPFCGIAARPRDTQPFPHHIDCPWLAMPKIVAALEEIERLQFPRSVSPSEVLSMRGQGMTYKAIAQHFGTYVEKIRAVVAVADRESRRNPILLAALKGESDA